MTSERCSRDQESFRVSVFSSNLATTKRMHLVDKIPGPYKNEEEARAANNGAYPPDLSLYILPCFVLVAVADSIIGL